MINFKNKNLIFYILILGFSIFSMKAFATWTIPTAVPNTPNTPTPIHVGDALQNKNGSIIVNGFRSVAPVIFNSTINIPTCAVPPCTNKVLTSDTLGNATWESGLSGWSYSSGATSMSNTDNLLLGTSSSSIYKGSVSTPGFFINNLGSNTFFAGLGSGTAASTPNSTAVGAGAAPTTGSNSFTSLGYTTATLAGNNNTIIGSSAGLNTTGLSNATAIGSNTVVNASNTMVFGNSSVVGWGFGVQPAIGTACPTNDVFKVGTNSTNGNGARLTPCGVWTNASDRTKKHNIQNLNLGLNEILKLRPVSFNWNGTNQSDIGLIAQEVKEVLPQIVYGKEGDYTVGYSQLTPVLVNAVRETEEVLNKDQKDFENFEKELKALEEKLK